MLFEHFPHSYSLVCFFSSPHVVVWLEIHIHLLSKSDFIIRDGWISSEEGCTSGTWGWECVCLPSISPTCCGRWGGCGTFFWTGFSHSFHTFKCGHMLLLRSGVRPSLLWNTPSAQCMFYLSTCVPIVDLQDRILCVPDEQHELAVELFTSRSDILKPCGPLPLRRPDLLKHKYPRFKAIGRTDFWLLLPASYCHIACEPNNMEWSQS